MEYRDYFYLKNFKGKTIYITNWSDLKDENKLIDRIWETTRLIESLQVNDALEMIIFKNSAVTKSVLLEMQKAAKVARPYNKKKAGVTDFSPTRLYILKTINFFSNDKIQPFENEEDALNWLVKE